MDQLRLLLVEDNEDDAELVCLELAGAGFLVTHRRVDSEDAFRSALDEPWDIIISDFKMPGFNGLRAFELYRERGLDTPFLFVSGELGEERAVEAMRAGARDYILKGNLARLAAATRRELAEAKSRAARRASDLRAKMEQRRHAVAVEASGAGVFDYRVPLADDTYASEQLAVMFGYSGGSLLDGHQTFAEWLAGNTHPNDRALVLDAYRDFARGRADQLRIESRMMHADGHWIDVAVFAKAVERDGVGAATHVVGVMLEVTERRKLEHQLRQTQKMEAVGRLAGGVAHDFNNLLTAIFAFGQFVMDGLPDGELIRDDMEEVIKAAKKGQRLTSQLLAFSRRKPIAPKVVEMNAVIGDMAKMLRRLVGEDVELVTSLSSDAGKVLIDPGSLEQVVVNLAVNARDAMRDGGKLVVETANVVLTEDYGRRRGAEVRRGDYVLLAISDDGVGMDKHTQTQVFEPFFTTKGPTEGTGLGLSTCYGIVKQANGFIWVYSEPGLGTTFKIYLPRTTTELEGEMSHPPPANTFGTETILLVEDDPQVRRLAHRILRRSGYDLIVASNGREALRMATEAGRPIRLLLTDVVMPEMSGKALADRLQALQPDLAVVYMSGYTANAIHHKGVLEPGTVLIQKPFSPDEISRVVRQVLDDE